MLCRLKSEHLISGREFQFVASLIAACSSKLGLFYPAKLRVELNLAALLAAVLTSPVDLLLDLGTNMVHDMGALLVCWTVRAGEGKS